MKKYIMIRIIWVFVVLFILLSLNFFMFKMAPQFPPPDEGERDIYYTRQVTDGYMTREYTTDPEKILEWRKIAREGSRKNSRFVFTGRTSARAYFPVPLATQYFNWLKNVITEWNWGVSTRVQPNTPVFEVLEQRIGVTVQLNLLALVFYIPIGITLGIFAALKKDSLLDNLISVGVMIMISIPSFVVITLIMMVFGYQLGWLPTIFAARDVVTSIRLQGYIIPVVSLITVPVAGLTRLTRAELTEVLTSEFLLLARAKGLTRSQAVVRHALRNSLVPIIPSIIFAFTGMFAGAVIIEIIYSIPGAGRLYLRALTQSAYDYNLLLALTAFYSAISFFGILFVDLAYGVVDPRIRMGARK